MHVTLRFISTELQSITTPTYHQYPQLYPTPSNPPKDTTLNFMGFRGVGLVPFRAGQQTQFPHASLSFPTISHPGTRSRDRENNDQKECVNPPACSGCSMSYSSSLIVTLSSFGIYRCRATLRGRSRTQASASELDHVLKGGEYLESDPHEFDL